MRAYLLGCVGFGFRVGVLVTWTINRDSSDALEFRVHLFLSSGVYPKVVSCLQGDSHLKPAWSQFSFPSLLPAWSFYCTRRLYSSYVSLSRVLVADEAGQEASGDETILGRNRFCLWSASFLWHQLRSCCVCPLTYTHSISSWCMSSAAL